MPRGWPSYTCYCMYTFTRFHTVTMVLWKPINSCTHIAWQKRHINNTILQIHQPRYPNQQLLLHQKTTRTSCHVYWMSYNTMSSTRTIRTMAISSTTFSYRHQVNILCCKWNDVNYIAYSLFRNLKQSSSTNGIHWSYRNIFTVYCL